MAVGQAIDLVALLGMEDRLDDGVFRGIQQLFARALAPREQDRPSREAGLESSIPSH
jgi:hypothetical protein